MVIYHYNVDRISNLNLIILGICDKIMKNLSFLSIIRKLKVVDYYFVYLVVVAKNE